MTTSFDEPQDRGRPRSTPYPMIVVTVASAQLLLAAGYATAGLWYLATLRASGWDHEGMQNNLYDPRNSIPFGDSLLNPVHWILLLAQMAAVYGWLLSPALLVVLLAYLRQGWGSVARPTRCMLVVAILAAVAVPVVFFSPPGEDLGHWLLD